VEERWKGVVEEMNPLAANMHPRGRQPLKQKRKDVHAHVYRRSRSRSFSRPLAPSRRSWSTSPEGSDGHHREKDSHAPSLTGADDYCAPNASTCEHSMSIAHDALIARVSNIGCKWLCEVHERRLAPVPKGSSAIRGQSVRASTHPIQSFPLFKRPFRMLETSSCRIMVSVQVSQPLT
jgi:hypothetical protein